MVKATFINLAVADLPRAIEFFIVLGFTFDAQLTDDNAAALAIADKTYVMLHATESLGKFTGKPLVDPHTATEVLVTLQMERREEVDELLSRALAAGAVEQRPPLDQGFTRSRAFEDLDGHIWELFWMSLDDLL
jgi:predicted lactoylglutathione lyase